MSKSKVHPWRKWSGRVPEKSWPEFEKRKEQFIRENPRPHYDKYNTTLNQIAKEVIERDQGFVDLSPEIDREN